MNHLSRMLWTNGRVLLSRQAGTAVCLIAAIGLLTVAIPQSAFADDDAVDRAIDAMSEAVDDRDVDSMRAAMEQVERTFQKLEEDDRDRYKLARLLARMLEYPDSRENRIAYLAADLLGRMGDPGSDYLSRALDHPDIDDEDLRDLRDVMIRALGATRHPSAVETLLDFLKHRHPDAVIASAKALGNFADARGRLRKEIAGALLRASEYVDSQTDGQRSRGVERIKTLERKWFDVPPVIHQTLSAITGAKVAQPHDPEAAEKWRAWFEEHKSDNWDITKAEW